MILGPLGNGFPQLPVEKAYFDRRRYRYPSNAGIGKELSCKKTAVLGYRDVLFLNEEFAPYADVVLATEDGSAGTKEMY